MTSQINRLIEQNKSTDMEKFTPTPHMLHWLDITLQLMTDNINEIARVSGIDESSWYKWLKKDEFRLWFRREWEKRLAGVAFKLDAIGLRNSKRDHKFWHDMMVRVGNIPSEQKTNVAVQVNNLIEKDREEFL